MSETCGTGDSAEFWLVTHPIRVEKPLAEEIYVDVEAELTMCFNHNMNYVECQSNYFAIYIYRGLASLSVIPSPPTVTEFLKIFSHLVHNITNSTSPSANLSKSTQTFSFPRNNSEGVIFAVRSRGAYVLLLLQRIFYKWSKI